MPAAATENLTLQRVSGVLMPLACAEFQLMKRVAFSVDFLTHGAKKYGRDNWMDVQPFEPRYENGLLRHTLTYVAGEKNDGDTGLNHLAHAICNCLFLMHGGYGK